MQKKTTTKESTLILRIPYNWDAKYISFQPFLMLYKNNTFQFVKSSEETEEVTTHDRDRPGKKLIAG